MLDVEHCAGCEDDFYNGQNPYGITECWARKKAEFATYKLIHVDLAPPYLHVPERQLPTCYRKKRYVKVKPEALDAQGYWRSR